MAERFADNEETVVRFHPGLMAKETKMKRVKKKAKDEKFKVYLLYESDTSGGGICKGQEDDEWPYHEDEYNTFKPIGLRLKPPAWSETIEIVFDPSGLDHLYIVIVRYSSGSTFGTTHGHWHIEGAYKTYDEAEKIEIDISKSTGKYDSNKVYVPWEGYFERFERVTVERMDIWK